MKKILDVKMHEVHSFTLLPSPQTRWQHKMRKQGRCIICGERTPFVLVAGERRHLCRCLRCALRQRESRARARHNLRKI